MHKGIIAWVVIFVVLIALWYFFSDFANPFGRGTTTTVVGNTVGYTTVPGTVYTCIGEDAEAQGFNSVIRQSCTWGGGPIALWAASGMAGHTNAWVIGQDGHVYINETFTNPCIAFENVYNLPAQEYSVIVGSGLRNATQGRSACGYMGIEMGSLPDSANATFRQGRQRQLPDWHLLRLDSDGTGLRRHTAQPDEGQRRGLLPEWLRSGGATTARISRARTPAASRPTRPGTSPPRRSRRTAGSQLPGARLGAYSPQ